MSDLLSSSSFLNDLEKCTVSTKKKRITYELNEIVNLYSSISINFEEKLIITIEDNEYNNIYTFIIGQYYPFKPPHILVNSKPYLNILNTRSIEFEKQLRELKGIDCFCCNSITHNDKWRPTNTLQHLITEIRMYKKYREDVVDKIMLEKNNSESTIDFENVNLINDLIKI